MSQESVGRRAAARSNAPQAACCWPRRHYVVFFIVAVIALLSTFAVAATPSESTFHVLPLGSDGEAPLITSGVAAGSSAAHTDQAASQAATTITIQAVGTPAKGTAGEQHAAGHELLSAHGSFVQLRNSHFARDASLSGLRLQITRWLHDGVVTSPQHDAAEHEPRPPAPASGLRIVSTFDFGEASAAEGAGCADRFASIGPEATLTLFEGEQCAFLFTRMEAGDEVTLLRGARSAPAASRAYLLCFCM